MAVCNIFNSLKKHTGNFLTFSQYSEDLTKEHVDNYIGYVGQYNILKKMLWYWVY